MSKCKDAFLGLAIGDALGVPFELVPRSQLIEFPVRDMIGHKAHDKPAGTWSDDGSLTFCTAEGLIGGFDTERLGKNFLDWFDHGYWSADGKAFGSGGNTRAALDRIRRGHRAVTAGSKEHEHSGNGSLMRILPLAFYVKDMPLFKQYSYVEQASSITHGSTLSHMCCFYYVQFAIGLLEGVPRHDIYSYLQEKVSNFLLQSVCTDGGMQPEDVEMLNRLLDNEIYLLPESDIKSSSYVLDTLEASIWCFMTTDSYEEAVLKAVNLGGDSDSTAAVTGGLAGIRYGLKFVPDHWLTSLARYDDILDLCDRFEASLSKAQ